MSLEYALITDSSLPNAVKESEYYVSVDKKQWLDLIDYSESIVEKDSSQKILFLIVAKGTPEQEAEDLQRKKEQEAARKALDEERKSLKNSLSEQERLKEEAELLRRQKLADQEELRKKSKSIFNALYRR